VVTLRIIEGLSTTETAAVLGRAEGTVKASFWRALQRLRGELAHAGEQLPDALDPLPGSR
jgi:DNA-directed RNA polymerase specialized sigma24 family protein